MTDTTEMKLVYLRQGAGDLPELCLGNGDGTLRMVIVLRPEQLAGIALEAVRLSLMRRGGVKL